MAAGHVVVIGTSAGGIEALRVVAAALPADFPAPICVVMHTSPQSPGILPDILDRAGPLSAVAARSGQRLTGGVIHVAPPDRHLIVEPGLVRTTRGPRENRFRPAIDPLFRSAAQVYGPAAIGVILSGNLDDGAAGLWTIKQLGGIAIVQAPDEALFPSMPLNAMRQVVVDHVVRLAELAPLLTTLVQSAPGVGEITVVPDETRIEVEIASEHQPVDAGVHDLGDASTFACPDCHGVLLRLKRSGPIRFRCHTGHAFTGESLLAALRDEAEETLWSAVRSLQEGALLMEQMARHAADAADTARAAALDTAARDARQRADRVRQLALVARETGDAVS